MRTGNVKHVENDVTTYAQDIGRTNLDLQGKVSDKVKLEPLTLHCQRFSDTDMIQNVSGSLKLLEGVETSHFEIDTTRNILNLTSTLKSFEEVGTIKHFRDILTGLEAQSLIMTYETPLDYTITF